MKSTGWAEMTRYDTVYTQQRDLLKATTAGSPLNTSIVDNKSILSKQLCFKIDCCRYERPLNPGISATKCGTVVRDFLKQLTCFLPSPSLLFNIRHHTSTEDTETGHSLLKEDVDTHAWITSSLFFGAY